MIRKFSILSLAAAIAVSGCTTRFIDDFEVDPAGGAPLVEPDGAPDDRVYILNGSGSITVSNSAPITGAKSLNIGGPGSNSASAPNVFMYADAIADSSQRVYASWTGRLSSGAGARIAFWAGHFSTIVEIVLEDGVIIAGGNQIGTYNPGQNHTILVNANPATDTYEVTALGSVSSGGSVSGAVANPASFPQNNIGLTFQLIDGSTADSYKVDGVRMSERNPS